MINKILDWTGLDPDSCAELLRVSKDEFQEWLSGSVRIPAFVDRDLATLAGVPLQAIKDLRKDPTLDVSSQLSPVLFKIRNEKRLTSDDQRAMATLRYLGNYGRMLTRLTLPDADNLWISFRERILEQIDKSVSPSCFESQGKAAAKAFRSLWRMELEPLGKILRPRLRREGLLFFESAVRDSELRGACFEVKDDDGSAPCIFVNSYACSWFQRNEVLLHELCHAIFDIAESHLTMDLRGDNLNAPWEIRANSFAREAALPESCLRHCSNQLGTDWRSLDAIQLAKLVGESCSEASTVLLQAQVYGLISKEEYSEYISIHPGDHLREYSDHALTRVEYLEKFGSSVPPLVKGRHTTMFAPKSMWLSAGYVDLVLRAVDNYKITPSRAASMLFISEEEFAKRFQSMLTLELAEA